MLKKRMQIRRSHLQVLVVQFLLFWFVKSFGYSHEFAIAICLSLAGILIVVDVFKENRVVYSNFFIQLIMVIPVYVLSFIKL